LTFVPVMFSWCAPAATCSGLTIAFAPMRARKLVRGLRQGLSEDERYLVADAVVHQLQERGDPWRLSKELPEATGKGYSTPPMDKR
jgi:hypothetical protein